MHGGGEPALENFQESYDHQQTQYADKVFKN